MSEWTPEDAARLRQYASRPDTSYMVSRALGQIQKLEKEVETLEEALASHVRDASEPASVILGAEEAARLGEITQEHLVATADAPHAAPLVVRREPNGNASVMVGCVLHPLDPPSPDPRIERTAEWLYLSSFDPMPGGPPPWSECPPSHQKTMRIRARDLLAAIDGEADDE